MPPVVSSAAESGTQCSIHVPSSAMDEQSNSKININEHQSIQPLTPPPPSPGIDLLTDTISELIQKITQTRLEVETMFSEAEKNTNSPDNNPSVGSRNAIIQYFRNMDFMEHLIRPYAVAFENLKIQKREQIDELCRKYGLNENKRLEDVESSWDQLLKLIDLTLSSQSKDPIVKENLEYGKLRLVDCDTEREIKLSSCLNHKYGNFTLFVLVRFYGCLVSERYVLDLHTKLQEFHQRLCNVVVVCKGTKEGGKKWRQLIGLNLPVLADERGEFIAAFHFPISVWNMCRTFERCCLGTAMILNQIHILDDAQKDLYQLGGEVLLNSRGKMYFIHKCQSTEDRPPWPELLALIDEKTRGGTRIMNNAGKTNEKQNKKSMMCLLM